jgi:hypothetical protein
LEKMEKTMTSRILLLVLTLALGIGTTLGTPSFSQAATAGPGAGGGGNGAAAKTQGIIVNNLRRLQALLKNVPTASKSVVDQAVTWALHTPLLIYLDLKSVSISGKRTRIFFPAHCTKFPKKWVQRPFIFLSVQIIPEL